MFAVFYGLDWIAAVPPTVRLTARRHRAVGIMVGWIAVIHQVGGAAAAYLGGVLRIAFGTYLEAFMLSGLLCLGAALMVLFIGAGRRGASRRRSQPQPFEVPGSHHINPATVANRSSLFTNYAVSSRSCSATATALRAPAQSRKTTNGTEQIT